MPHENYLNQSEETVSKFGLGGFGSPRIGYQQLSGTTSIFLSGCVIGGQQHWRYGQPKKCFSTLLTFCCFGPLKKVLNQFGLPIVSEAMRIPPCLQPVLDSIRIWQDRFWLKNCLFFPTLYSYWWLSLPRKFIQRMSRFYMIRLWVNSMCIHASCHSESTIRSRHQEQSSQTTILKISSREHDNVCVHVRSTYL